jgi:hypothetical protein
MFVVVGGWRGMERMIDIERCYERMIRRGKVRKGSNDG